MQVVSSKKRQYVYTYYSGQSLKSQVKVWKAKLVGGTRFEHCIIYFLSKKINKIKLNT